MRLILEISRYMLYPFSHIQICLMSPHPGCKETSHIWIWYLQSQCFDRSKIWQKQWTQKLWMLQMFYPSKDIILKAQVSWSKPLDASKTTMHALVDLNNNHVSYWFKWFQFTLFNHCRQFSVWHTDAKMWQRWKRIELSNDMMIKHLNTCSQSWYGAKTENLAGISTK